jgi:hypothetical protein
MIYLLAAIIIAEFFYIVYQDIANRRERERLQMKLMSRNIEEYKEATEPPPKPAESVKDPYRPLEEISTEKLINAKDNL